MIIKGLIDQNYKILHRDKLHLENVTSPDKVNSTFPSENGDNTEENLDKDIPFINTQETPLTKSQVSFNNPKIESTLVLINHKELDNVRAKILALKSFLMDEIYDLRQEFHPLDHSLNKKDFGTQKIMIAWKKRRTIIKS